MYIDFNDIVIELDASVRHITSAACMHLSLIPQHYNLTLFISS